MLDVPLAGILIPLLYLFPQRFAHAHDCPSTTQVGTGGPFRAVDFSEKAQAVHPFIFP